MIISMPILTNHRFYILFACFNINMCLGILYTWSIFKNALIVDYGWSNALASLPYTVAIFMLSITLILAGILQDRIGPKFILIVGSLLVGLGLILSTFAETPLTLSLTFGLCTGSGIGLCYACLNPTAMKWFHFTQKGMVNGLLAAGFGLSAVYLAPLISSLISTVDLQEAFFIVGTIILFISIPFALTIDNPKNIDNNAKLVHNKNQSPIEEVNWLLMMKSPRFYSLWTMYCVASSVGLTVIVNITTIALIQAEISDAVYLVVIFAIFNTVGRLFAGIISDKIGCLETLILSFMIQAVNVYFFEGYSNSTELMIGTAITGVGYGSLLSAFPSASVEHFGLKNFGANYGILFTAWGIGGIIGPTLTAFIVDMTSSYELAYKTSVLMLVVISIIGIFTKYNGTLASISFQIKSMLKSPN